MKYALVLILTALAISTLAFSSSPLAVKPTRTPVSGRPTQTATITQAVSPTPTITAAAPTATTQPTERPEVTFYTGVWNSCLTDQVNMGNDSPNAACTALVNQMIAVNAYKYRHSDMWQPLPASVVIP